MTALYMNKRKTTCCLNRRAVFQTTNGLLSFLFLLPVFRMAATQAYPTFHIPDSDSQFQTHFIDTSTDSIYIGALNNIYKVSSELSLQSSTSTGPVQDNQLCRPAPSNCDHERTTTDHHSKLILVHQNRLITCGNIYQGTCDIRDPDSLNVTYGDSIREVVPNTPAGLAVAFIADAAGDEVLYVASSYGRWLRQNIPTVSTRLIANTVEESKLFKISSDDAEIIIPTGTVANQIFNISYIHGFTSGQFSYFVAYQPLDHTASSKYVSKLVRICQGHPDFYSYVELPLVCATDSDNEYNLVQSAYLATLSLGGNKTEEVLVAAFSKSETEISDTPLPESAVCIYPVEDINRAFYERRINCAQQGTDNTEINWLGSTPCRVSQPLVDAIVAAGPDGYCHEVDTMSPLGADNRVITISSTPVYESNLYITAVAAVQHFETSIIFVGDSDGWLRKLRVGDAMLAVGYENRQLHQTPVIRNGLLLSQDKEFVFVVSENQITKVPVEECHEYMTCEECHSARDPYCGWCSLQAECTRRINAECTGSENGTSPRWLSTDDDCLTIISVTPEYAPAETVTELTLEISSLPPIPSTGLSCVFMEGSTVLGMQPVMETSDMSKVKCNTLGDITATSEGFRMVELQIHYEENGQSRNIVATNFDFYDCTKLSSCSLCAGNKYECHWCLYSNQCKDSAQTCNNTDVTSESSCPRLLQSEEILIPAGQQQRIEIDGENFPSDTFSYTCRIDFGGQDQLIIQASVEQSKIVCDRTLFNYSSTEESRKGSLQVYWGDFALDMEDNLTVTLYKCNQKAVTVVDGSRQQTCGKCLTIDARYQCGWCPASSSCLSLVNAATCPQNQLLSREMSCPNPTIVSVSPLSGHISGGTRLAIGGFNLGLVSGDVKLITVAGADCSSMEFESSQKLYCTTSSVPALTSGKVIIQFSDSQIPAATSDDDFSYVKPTVLSVFPTKGPQSGGTRLVIRGEHLNAGTDRAVEISASPCSSQEGYPCEIIEGNIPEEIVCRTSSGNITNGRIAVTFDLGCETGGDPFSYRADPVVDSFEKVTSIVSGGLDLTISGDFFDIIQEASMDFRIADETFQAKCTNESSKMKLYCNTPNITLASTSLPFSLPAENVSLYMDGVTTYTNLGSSFPGTRTQFFIFYSDPVYYQLPSGEDSLKIQYEEQRTRDIIIQGKNLTLASSKEDVTVKIGRFDCTVFKLTNREVTCRPSSSVEPAEHPVVVHHGNLRFSVGKVEYLDKGFPWQTVAGIIAAVIFLILICSILILLCHCCLNVRDNEKYFKELEEQRDAMEMVVAQECKEAFAELQTGVLSITKDVEGTGIPMWDYRSYAMCALFPNQPNHAVLRELTIPPAQRESVRKGLNRFGMLLANKSFLVHFVEVLEKQNTLGVEDLSNIASLLMVTCQGRMDYATAVMKTLLAKAIKEHVREGQEAVLMRRGVHIVEKIVSHWLALLMYPFLEEVAADPLFSLFYAIHRQIFSGPVDEVTSLARYGLNEAALIRQKVEHVVLTLYVKGIDNNMDDVKVQVLDCDTISQVKEKILEEIYKTSHYSTRPHRGEVDLEWSDSPNGKVLLLDYHGMKTDEGWRRLNTLRSYGVKDKASVSLLQTQNGNTSLSSSSSSPSRSINVYASLSATSSMTPIITHEKEPAAQFMHLVKQTEAGTSKKFDGKKVIAEIYLTRLLTTKGIIQPFVDDLLNTILTIEEDGRTTLPLAIKYLFDFLDEQAAENHIKDLNVVHQWKSNCLQLRFWVNLIKNPNFVYDVNKTPAVDNCLSVIGQCLMDSCSISQQTLTKDSPSSRLLYAKEIPRYRELVSQYYKGISKVPAVSDQDMNTMLADFSSQHQTEFYALTALNELYFCYAVKCKNELRTSLQCDESCHKYQLVEKLEEVERLLSS